MRISKIRIRNFRRLKDIAIDFSTDTTLFVGANNSGKTSVMDALRKFLVKGENNGFVCNDITVTNRSAINEIATGWIGDSAEKPADSSPWLDIFPSMDAWLCVEKNEYHYVSAIIPTLDWDGGCLGLRLSLLPKDNGKLFDDYREAYIKARNTEKADENSVCSLFPNNLFDYIARHMGQYFEIKSFVLDPAKIADEQPTDFSCECIDKNPLADIVKVDMITAQRGLSDADSANNVVSLSQQLRMYYDKHLDVDKNTSPEDLETLSALRKAQETFDGTLKIKFKDSFNELAQLGFPGVSDPKITIESKFQEKTAFEHESAVRYALSEQDKDLHLPEKYNGLGYQNLIAIAFKLMSFRDDRIHKGKAQSEDHVNRIAPLHLVLLEEPEAHLHVQVQQVLIQKAYDILTKAPELMEQGFNTQLAVSTHSSHIADKIPFGNIRYFRRERISRNLPVPFSEVINLANTFGDDEDTEKFVHRYLNVMHCDLFFADAVIFVEGISENILVPYFIKTLYRYLDSRYITVLPVGGRHSHKFKPLIEKLGIYTLVITDVDTSKPDGHHKSAPPKKNMKLISGNSSITKWGIVEKEYDKLLALPDDSKIFNDETVRVAYQTQQSIEVNGLVGEALSATFEDSLVYANIDAVLRLDSVGIVGKLQDALKSASIDEVCQNVYNAIHNDSSGKVSFALDMIYGDSLNAPRYIDEGLTWLQAKLSRNNSEADDGEQADEQT